MECEFTAQVSALMDGELEEQEANSLREHLNACEACQEAEREFLLLRREIQSYRSQAPQGEEERNALARLLRVEKVSFWKRRIALPMPALALFMLAVLALGIWMIAARRQQESKLTPPAAREGKRTVLPPAPATSPGGEIDLARFDNGGRAVMYKVRLDNALNKRQ
jgi:anti-sigma factor RsiW